MYAVIYIIGVAIEEIRVTVTALVSRLEVRTKFIKLIKSIVHATPCLSDWDRHARNYITCLGKTQAIPLSPLPSPSQCFFFFFFFSLLPGFFIVIINDFLTTVATK